MSMKNFSVNIGNRNRDISACSAVSQLTAPPSAPETLVGVWYHLRVEWFDPENEDIAFVEIVSKYVQGETALITLTL